MRAAQGATNGHDSIVILSPFPWRGLWQTSHYLAREFAKGFPVVYAEPSPEWHPWALNFDARQVLRVLRGRPIRSEGSVTILTPRSLPLGRFPAVRRANERLYAQALRALREKLRLQRPLYWVFYQKGCLPRLLAQRPSKYIYHCLDFFPHGDRAEEETLAANAAVVFSVSRPLHENLGRVSKHAFLLPNGVDAQSFEEEDPTCPKPHDLPRGGFSLIWVGAIAHNKVDFGLLLSVALAFPGERLLLIGPVQGRTSAMPPQTAVTIRRLLGTPNVSWLGYRHPHTLGGYVREAQTCLVPLLPTETSRHADPLKFLQFLAAGKPVVASAQPSFEPYRDLSYLANSPAEFVTLVGAALAEKPSTSLVSARRAAARARDWRLVAEDALQTVSAVLRSSQGVARNTR